MLIQFSVGNFRSYSEVKTLSMEATAISDFQDNVHKEGNKKLLLGAVLYGANASGKSNFLRAMGAMKKILTTMSSKPSSEKIPYDPFLKQINKKNEPSYFEVVFLLEGLTYRYGFEVNGNVVVGEWLFETVKKTERPLFVRVNDGIEVMRPFKEGMHLEEKTRDNVLFLSVVDQFNGTVAKKIMAWFDNFKIIDGVEHKKLRPITYSMLENEVTRLALVDYYKQLDLGFDDIQIYKEAFDPEKLGSGFPEELLKQIVFDLEGKTMVSLKTLQKQFDENGHPMEAQVEFNLRSQESTGTNKIVDLSGPIFATLRNGGVLAVDELDAQLHPLITMSIVRLFQNKEVNKKHAQLVFATHDTNLLSLGEFRRDQIYFCEKNEMGATDLYSLVEYGGVRKDRSFEKDYINGRYGAIPYLDNNPNINLLWPAN